MKVVIADDEPLARDRLRAMLAGEAGVEVVAEAGDGHAALHACAEHHPDMVLLDISMPGIDGLETARHLASFEPRPAVVFCTAYDAHALSAFEAQAIDYLVKPVRANRLAAALLKVRHSRPAPAQVLAQLQQGARTHLSCHERGRLLLIPVCDIIYLKADLKYVTARTASREYLLDESLTHLEEEFSERFIRLHRSALVAKDAIAGFEKGAPEDGEQQWQALLRGIPEKLPVSRRQWPLVKTYAKQLSS